jgi:hypothetical protein
MSVYGKSFGLSMPHEYLDKLKWEFEKLMKAGDASSRDLSYHAMNLAMTGWHMTDGTPGRGKVEVRKLLWFPEVDQGTVENTCRMPGCCYRQQAPQRRPWTRQGSGNRRRGLRRIGLR